MVLAEPKTIHSLKELENKLSAPTGDPDKNAYRYNSALCAVRKVYFSAQPNNLKLILKFEKYFPVEHIFVSACSSARKIHFFKFY